MKPVILQNLTKKNRKEFIKTDPTAQEVEQASSKFFNFVLVALALIVVLSITLGA
jgi:hypothetical protein